VHDIDNKLPGLTVSVPLFFKKDESVDYYTLGRYLDDVCSNQRIFAVYSMAYNTRYRMLTGSEVIDVNKFIITKVKSKGHRTFIGHPYIFTRSTLAQYLKEMAEVEPDGISMLYPERYYGLDDPIINFLSTPLDYGLNVVVHEMKLISGFNGELVDWPEPLLQRTFEELPLLAIKEDSKSDQITRIVLDLSKDKGVFCVLAGGGKSRAEKFIKKGLVTWLNGSTMFCPRLIDEAYTSFMHGDHVYKNWYLTGIERPFFDEVVSKFGWHLAHRVALSFFGYGEIYERFPHAEMPQSSSSKCYEVLQRIREVIDAADHDRPGV
jgi:dihydrodipicolinate synthase/N-acetylneuraminate lyase